jgi:signal peptidase I
MRTALGLGCIGLGLFGGVRIWMWTQGATGEVLGRWTWLIASPILLLGVLLVVAGIRVYRSTDLPRGEEPIPLSRVGLQLLGATGVCSLLSLVAFLWPAYEVPDEEMSYSMQPGEWVWILPVDWLDSPGLLNGDVVLITDPMDSERQVLRRIVAGPGQTVRYAMGELKLSPRVTRKVMNERPVEREGHLGTWNVHSETLFGTPPKKLVELGKREKAVPGEGPDTISFLVRNLNETLRWRIGQGLRDESEGSRGPDEYRVTVPDGYWYLMADDRDVALDSRWWGPVAEADIHGVVRLHHAQADVWREEWQVLRGVE